MKSHELEEVERFIAGVMSALSTTERRLKEYCQAQERDPVCSRAAEYCQSGWPAKQVIEQEHIPYWKVRSFLSMHDHLLLYNDRIVVPCSLREETISRLHEGHQGIERCCMCAKYSVWWPGISKQLTEAVSNCQECARDASPRNYPLMPTPLPEYPWQMIGSDLFVLEGNNYFLVVDYFSRYPEVIKLS